MSNSISNSSDLTGFSLNCIPSRFLVPMFGGSLTESNSYASLSDQAHIVLGIFIALLVTNWCLFIMEFNIGGLNFTLKRAYRIAGSIQLSMGIYLFLWIFCILNYYSTSTAASNEFYSYIFNDLLQLQHMGIALLLMTCGSIDLFQSYFLLISSHWNSLWTLNMSLVGLLFLTHPQKSYSAAVKHVSLGISIVFAGIFYSKAKENLRILMRVEMKLLELYTQKYNNSINNDDNNEFITNENSREIERGIRTKRTKSGKYGELNNISTSNNDNMNNNSIHSNTKSKTDLHKLYRNLSDPIEYKYEEQLKLLLLEQHGNSIETVTPIGNSSLSFSIHPILELDWSLVFSGCAFSMASMILLIFRESPIGPHFGTSIICQSAWPLTQFAYFMGFFSLFLSFAVVFIFSSYGAPMVSYCFPRNGCCCRWLDRYLDLDNNNNNNTGNEENNNNMNNNMNNSDDSDNNNNAESDELYMNDSDEENIKIQRHKILESIQLENLNNNNNMNHNENKYDNQYDNTNEIINMEDNEDEDDENDLILVHGMPAAL